MIVERVDLDRLTDDVVDVGNAVEIKLVRRLAQYIGVRSVAISIRAISALIGAAKKSVERAIQAAEHHGFLVVDRSTSPNTFTIDRRYVVRIAGVESVGNARQSATKTKEPNERLTARSAP